MYSDKLQLSLINNTLIKNVIDESHFAQGQGKNSILNWKSINCEMFSFCCCFSGICKKWETRLDY